MLNFNKSHLGVFIRIRHYKLLLNYILYIIIFTNNTVAYRNYIKHFFRIECYIFPTYSKANMIHSGEYCRQEGHVFGSAGGEYIDRRVMFLVVQEENR